VVVVDDLAIYHPSTHNPTQHKQKSNNHTTPTYSSLPPLDQHKKSNTTIHRALAVLEGQGKTEEARPVWQRLLQFEAGLPGDRDAARCVYVVCVFVYAFLRERVYICI
jgi:hypothetical protein